MHAAIDLHMYDDAIGSHPYSPYTDQRRHQSGVAREPRGPRPGGGRLRVAVGRMWQESNDMSPVLSTRAMFGPGRERSFDREIDTPGHLPTHRHTGYMGYAERILS